MDKEKILEKARQEQDEGVENVKRQGLNLGYKIFIGLSILLMTFNLIQGRESSAVMALFFGFMAADAYSRYQFLKGKSDLLIIIGASLACILFLANHVLYSLR